MRYLVAVSRPIHAPAIVLIIIIWRTRELAVRFDSADKPLVTTAGNRGANTPITTYPQLLAGEDVGLESLMVVAATDQYGNQLRSSQRGE